MKRMYSIDGAKFIAAFLVICIHEYFPGTFGEAVAAIARTAVPFYFITSGYFLWNDDQTQQLANIRKRVKGVFKLNVWANLLYFVWELFQVYVDNQNVYSYLEGVTSKEAIKQALLLNQSPVAGHLWYLSAYLYVLILYYAIIRFNWLNESFRIVPLFLIMALMHGKYAPWVLDASYPINYTRNFLFTGLPYFLIGVFIRKELKDKNRTIKNSYLQLGLLIFTATTWLEEYALQQSQQTVKGDLYISTTFLVVTLFIYLIQRPALFQNTWIAQTGSKLTTYIYVVHPILITTFERMFEGHNNAVTTAYDYLAPLLVLAMSTIVAILYSRLKSKLEDSRQSFGKTLGSYG